MTITDAFKASGGWVWIAAVFAAAFRGNGRLHAAHGIAGKTFSTRFSGGAGRLDSPGRNVL